MSHPAPSAPAVAPPATGTAPAPRRRSVWVGFLLPWLLLAALGSIWALATPISGSPDEPAHVVKAASVVRGQLLPSEMIAVGGVVEVPAAFDYEYSQGCFAFYPDTPASCAPPLEGDPTELVLSHSSASLYNPVYYLLVGWPSLLLPDVAGIYAMRIVSAVLTTFFLAAAFWIVAGWRRARLPALGILIALTPMAVYLTGTVNPNPLEFTGGLALFTGMLAITLHPDERRLGPRLALVVIAALLVSNTRGISPLWVALLLVIPLILLTARQLGGLLKRPGVIISILLIALGAVYSAWWTLSSNSLGTGPSNGPDVVPDNEGVGLSPVQGFLGEIGFFYLRLRQMVGVLGWLDTWFNPLVYFISYAMMALLVVGVIVFVRGRRLVFLAVLALAFFFVPPAVQSVYVTHGGFIWQGRYTLVLLMALLVAMAACIAASPRYERWGRGRGLVVAAAWLVGAAWAFCGSWAFLTTLRRMSAGYENDWAQMFEPGAWTPPLGIVPLVVLFVLASAALVVVVAAGFRDRPETDQRPIQSTAGAVPAGPVTVPSSTA